MLDIDIDMNELEKINNPDIRDVIRQLKNVGIAYTKNNQIGRIISQRFPEYRKKNAPVLIISRDPRMDIHSISFNFRSFPPISTNLKMFEESIQRIIKEFK